MISKHKQWTNNIAKLINWSAIGTAMKRKKPIQRMKATQAKHDWQNAGTQKGLFTATGKEQTVTNSIISK